MKIQHPCITHPAKKKKAEIVLETFTDNTYHTYIHGDESTVISMLCETMEKNPALAVVLNSAVATFLIRQAMEQEKEHELLTHHTHIKDEEKS